MNPSTTSSSTGGRCGMCGSCGAMPPWAPEVLKTTSPEARLALEHRMEQMQKRFIEERDAKIKAKEADPSPQPSLGGIEPQQPLRDGDPAQIMEKRHDPNDVIPAKPPEEPIEQSEKFSVEQKVGGGLLPLNTQTKETTETDLDSTGSLTPLESGAFVEDDADIEIPLDHERLPPQLASDVQSDDKPVFHFFSDDQTPLQRPRRTSLSLTSPALQESPAPPENPELHTIPQISLEPNQLSEPLRTISLRDADSDAESFHTADEGEMLRRSSDRITLQNDDEEVDVVVPVVSQAQWQAFQDEDDFKPRFPATNQATSLEGHASDVSYSERSLQSTESVSSQPSAILEGYVSKAHCKTEDASPPQSNREVFAEDCALPQTFAHSSKTDQESRACHDCERWRERVQELELKVEALTSALDARERETASMRARSVDRHYHGKNETQLIQECESLRMTTEYLYYKLERYERKLNGTNSDAH